MNKATKILKRMLCFAIIIFQIILCSCNNKQVDELPKETKPEQIEILENAIIAAADGNYDGLGSRVYDAACPDFEYVVDRLLTDIVKATYTSSKIFNGGQIHIFDIIESFRGDIKEKEIYVWARIEELDCHKYENEYQKGESYLLLLQRTADPFLSFDTFKSIHPTLTIPLDSAGEPDIAKSKICRKDIISQITNEELKQACTEGRLIQYLQQITKDNPYKKISKGFTETYDKDFAIQKAEYVLKILISSDRNYDSFANPHITCFGVHVERQNILKGDKDVLPEFITIYLPSTIAPGCEYIVAINNTSYYNPNGNYIPSTRNSIYSIDEESQILEIINRTVN